MRAPTAVALLTLTVQLASSPSAPASQTSGSLPTLLAVTPASPDRWPIGAPAARVRVLEITPAPGSAVDENTIIEAVLEYEIDDPAVRRGTYYVHPLFSSTTGSLFNAIRIGEGTPLLRFAGKVKVKYAIANEYASPELAEPIHVSFHILLWAGRVLKPQPGIDLTHTVAKTDDVVFVSGRGGKRASPEPLPSPPPDSGTLRP